MIQFFWQILYNKLWYTSFSETSKEDRLAITSVSSSSSSSSGGGGGGGSSSSCCCSSCYCCTSKNSSGCDKNTIDAVCIILLLQFWKLLIGGGIVQDVW